MQPTESRRGKFPQIVDKVALFVVVLAGINYGGTVYFQSSQEVVRIALASFAVLLSLSSGFFAYSRALDDERNLRATVISCAERMLMASLYMLVAAILKFTLGRYESLIGLELTASFFGQVAEIIFSGLSGILIFSALFATHDSLKVMFKVLELKLWGSASVPTQNVTDSAQATTAVTPTIPVTPSEFSETKGVQ